jgi:hypothetical protein
MTSLNPLVKIPEELKFELKDSPRLRFSNRKANDLGKTACRKLRNQRILRFNALETDARQALTGSQ